MQIGIDVGATKIESVVLEKDGQEKHRSRISCPKDYNQIIIAIKDIHKKLEQEFKQELPIGVCHPGVHSPQTGLVKNAPNITWLEKKYGKIDVFINNAGIAGLNTTVAEYPLDEWNKVMNLNLNSVFYCCKAVVPFMIKND